MGCGKKYMLYYPAWKPANHKLLAGEIDTITFKNRNNIYCRIEGSWSRGYDVCFTSRRSWVQFPPSPLKYESFINAREIINYGNRII